MRVRVLYFASARDAAAVGSESMQLRDGASVNELAAEIMKAHPAFGKLAGSVRFSINLELVSQRTVLHDADEVGVLPPVAGG